MSVTLVTFSVDDTSPCVSYSPFGDTFSTPNLIAGWNPYFDSSGYATSQGEVGNGTSLHITSLDGASLGLQWSGTGITLMGNATRATYSITLDNQLLSNTNGSAADNILANIQGLNDTLHTIRLTAQIPESQNPPTSSMLVFDQAILFSSPLPVADNIGFQNQTLNDQQIAFLGSWSITSSVPGGPEFHSTHTVGDRAIANFSGTTLILLGQTSPSGGNYSVLLDNTVSTTLSARSSFTQSSSLLFFATDLDPATTHSIQVENLDGSELALLVGGFNAIVPYPIPPSATNTTMSTPTASTTSSSHVLVTNAFSEGTIAAFALAGILAFILISGALYFFCVYRPRQRRRRRHRSGGSFYPAGMERQKFTFDPPRGSPKAHEARGAGAGVSGIVGAGGRRGGGGRGRGEADVLDISPGFDKSMDLDLEDAGSSPIERSEEGRRGTGRRWSLLSDFQRWRRAAVRGSLGGVSLGIRFRSNSDSENEKAATAASPVTPPIGAGNGTGATTNTQTNMNNATRVGFLDTGRPVSSATSLPSSGSTARRERAKRKGKMRAVSGRSWSPSFMLDLPVWLGGRHSQSQTQMQQQSRRLSELRAQHMADAEHDIYTSFPVRDEDAALYAAHVEGRGRGHAYAHAVVEHPPSYAASVSLSNSNRDSIRESHSHSDPSFIVPSGPRSVSSNSPVFHGTDMLQQRRDSDSQNNNNAGAAAALRPGDSRHFLLSEAEGNATQDVPVSMASVSPQNVQAQANIKDTVPSSNVRPLPSVAQHKRQQQQQRHIYGQISTEPSPLSRKIMDPRLIETSLETTDDNPSIEEPRIMREVLRSLSPRTSRLLPIPPPPPRRMQPLQELVIAPTPTTSQAPAGVQSPASDEAPSPESVTSPTRRLLPLVESGRESRWMESAPSGGGRTAKALPRTPTSDDDDQGERVGLDEAAFLNMPETSPFRVNFDVKSTRTSIRPLPSTARSHSDTESHVDNNRAGGGVSSDESTSDPQYYTTAAESNYKPARNTFGASENGHAGGSRLSEFVQGTSSSHVPFRLPSISFPDPHQGPEARDGNATSSPDGPSPVGSEGVISFIDFTSSPEGSLRVPSEKSSSKKKAKHGRRRSLPVPPLIVDEPKSRWSNTTVATNPQGDNGGGEIGHINESSGESQKPISPLSEHRSTDSSTFPISVLVDIPGSAHYMETQQPDNSQRSSAFTQSDILHVHPTMENIESPTESLPLSTSEIRFRHSDSEGSSELRRPTAHSLSGAHEQPGASTDEYRPPPPFDPNILVSRVLGMSSPTSSVTARPPHPSQSNIALSSATNSIFPILSRHDSSNDQLNSSRPGQS